MQPLGSFKIRKKRSVGLISLVIMSCLILQATATFRVFCPPERLFPGLSSYRIFCAPFFWPFIDYAVYIIPHYEGEMLDQPLVFGILEDSTEVQIPPEDLGLSFTRWEWRQGLVEAFHQASDEEVRKYVESYRRSRLKKLRALRLENHPLVLSKTGLQAGQIEVLKVIELHAFRENM